MPSNVKFSIRVAQIEDLNDAMNKATKMEEIMLETDADPDIILGKVQRQMDTLNIQIKEHQLQEKLKIKEHEILKDKELVEGYSKE
jgi:hypothetical protein